MYKFSDLYPATRVVSPDGDIIGAYRLDSQKASSEPFLAYTLPPLNGGYVLGLVVRASTCAAAIRRVHALHAAARAYAAEVDRILTDPVE